ARRGVIALDVGGARIGVAAGEPGSRLAFRPGAPARRRTRPRGPAGLGAAAREGAAPAGGGLPPRLDGSESPQTQRVRAFAEALAAAAAGRGLAVVLEDERLTTRIAQRQVGGSALPRTRRQEKGRLDEAAAVLILESYLERTLASGGDAG